MKKTTIRKKVMIGVLSTERNNFSWLFIQSLINLKDFMGSKAIITYAHSGTIPDGRNLILDEAKKQGCDYALMIDSDMTFPSYGIDVLLETMKLMGAKIGCGLYFGTYPPFESKPMAYDEEDGKQIALDDWGHPRYVTSCGMGFTMIHKSLFDLRFIFKPGLGEDHLFCKDARALGHKIVLQPAVKCGHLRTIPLDEELVNKLYPRK